MLFIAKRVFEMVRRAQFRAIASWVLGLASALFRLSLQQ